jgi:DNA-binding XRE family transcriptional regulator
MLSRSAYKREFCERTMQARELAGYEPKDMASMLGVKRDTYGKYELRTPLPHHLVSRFCLICRVTEAWLFSGKGLPREIPALPGKRRGRPRALARR